MSEGGGALGDYVVKECIGRLSFSPSHPPILILVYSGLSATPSNNFVIQFCVATKSESWT